ncbi:hypothetical protein F4604DRAFT_1900478 [Suillus subluteus]|nr:hypothetical protein F4604DRAFT_1900478 [Suillus subluteus]
MAFLCLVFCAINGWLWVLIVLDHDHAWETDPAEANSVPTLRTHECQTGEGATYRSTIFPTSSFVPLFHAIDGEFWVQPLSNDDTLRIGSARAGFNISSYMHRYHPYPRTGQCKFLMHITENNTLLQIDNHNIEHEDTLEPDALPGNDEQEGNPPNLLDAGAGFRVRRRKLTTFIIIRWLAFFLRNLAFNAQ